MVSSSDASLGAGHKASPYALALVCLLDKQQGDASHVPDLDHSDCCVSVKCQDDGMARRNPVGEAAGFYVGKEPLDALGAELGSNELLYGSCLAAICCLI
jgi:hypothetical protein